MKPTLLSYLLLFCITLIPRSAISEDHVYTDQDLKKHNYEKLTPERKKPVITSSGWFEQRDPPFVRPSYTTEQIRKQIDQANKAEKERIQQQEDRQQRIDYRQSLDSQYARVEKEKTEKARAAGATILGTLILLPLMIIGLQFLLWIFALINILKNEFTGSNKLIWVLVVTFIPFIGPILYFFLGEQHKIYPDIA